MFFTQRKQIIEHHRLTWRQGVLGRMDKELVDFSGKTFHLDAFKKHLAVLVPQLATRFEGAFLPRIQGLRFEAFRRQQVGLERLRQRFQSHVPPGKKLILVWGNGGFGPTSKGHESSPNKGLRRSLSRFFPIIMSSEYLSSKRSPCCLSTVTHPQHKVLQRRVTLESGRALWCRVPRVRGGSVLQVRKRRAARRHPLPRDATLHAYTRGSPEQWRTKLGNQFSGPVLETLRNYVYSEDSTYRLKSRSSRGLFRCDSCFRPWNRDTAACLNIEHIFRFACKAKTLRRPRAFRKQQQSNT